MTLRGREGNGKGNSANKEEKGAIMDPEYYRLL